MTEPLTFIRYELDEQTRDELQPPCDCYRPFKVRCDDPAAWVVATVCPAGCRRAGQLYCEHHFGVLLAGQLICTPCKDAGKRSCVTARSAERL